MTRKDYVLIAAAIREAYGDNPHAGINARSFKGYDEGVDAVLNTLRRALGADNLRFDASRFNTAALPGGH